MWEGLLTYILSLAMGKYWTNLAAQNGRQNPLGFGLLGGKSLQEMR